ncbi:GNAT family N-acetyltransferase [Lachnospiraceae bacterium]|nr:GNAT family N-acetyltransferase [Lachnospiraceae bacterium]
MGNYELRSYRQKDMEQIVAGWNKSLLYDPVSEERFFQQVVMDENFDRDLALSLVKDGHIIGFCLGIKRKYPYLTRGLEPDRGWISIMYVLQEYQKQGCGQILLDEVEKRLKERQVKEITLCAYSPNYFTPGIDISYDGALSFFEKNAYEKAGDAVSMQRSLFTYSIPCHTLQKMEDFQKKGWKFCSYSERYMDKVLEFTKQEFDAGWVRNILQALRKKEAEDTILLAVDEKDQVVGYCMRKIDGNDARFGPIGVKEDLRSSGIGGILFDLQMREMQKRGICYAYFLWTHGDAMRFYERHGMSTYRTYRLYRKKL